MFWSSIMQNLKNEEIYTSCKKKIYTFCLEYYDKILMRAKQFLLYEKDKADYMVQGSREEIAANVKYMHRGYYCPSRIQELQIDNIKRGRIVKKTSQRTKITHRYYYYDNKLQVIDYYLPDSKYNDMEREYLIYEDDVVYGVTIDYRGCIEKLSAEIFNNGRLTTYMLLSCSYVPSIQTDPEVYEIYLEHFIYKDDLRCTGYAAYIYPNNIYSNDGNKINPLIELFRFNLKMDINNRWIEDGGQGDGSVVP